MKRSRSLDILGCDVMRKIEGGGCDIISYYTQTRSAFGDHGVIREWQAGFEIKKNPETPWWKIQKIKVIVNKR